MKLEEGHILGSSAIRPADPGDTRCILINIFCSRGGQKEQFKEKLNLGPAAGPYQASTITYNSKLSRSKNAGSLPSMPSRTNCGCDAMPDAPKLEPPQAYRLTMAPVLVILLTRCRSDDFQYEYKIKAPRTSFLPLNLGEHVLAEVEDRGTSFDPLDCTRTIIGTLN
jgi:hypothetical protein